MAVPADGEAASAQPKRFWHAPDWLFSLSLANVCFFRTWATVLETGRHVLPAAFFAAIANVLIIAVCIRFGYYVVQRSRSRVIRWAGILAFAGLLLLPFHGIATVNFPADIPKRNITYIAGLATAGATLLHVNVRTAIVKLLMMLTPFVLVTFGQSLSRAWAYDATRWQGPAVSASTSAAAREPRLVWIILDDWDYGLTFESKRRSLPEFERIVSESFHATNARPPSPERKTIKSVPRLVTGDATADLETMRSRPNVFSRAKEEGLHSAVVGWFVDYCGSFSNLLDVCWSNVLDAERGSMGKSGSEIAANQLKYLLETDFRSPFGQTLGTKRHILDYRFLLRSATQALASPRFNMVYAHLPVPHGPYFYDSATGRFNIGEKPIVSFFVKQPSRYMDHLQLADKSFGEIRRAMEASGVWEKTHVILTSDHSHRERRRIDGVDNDHRVPFIVRLAGRSEELKYDERFNTLLTTDLVMALLRQELRTALDVRDWIQRRASNDHDRSVE